MKKQRKKCFILIGLFDDVRFITLPEFVKFIKTMYFRIMNFTKLLAKSILESKEKPNDDGLFYSVSDLDMIYPVMGTMSIEELSKYSDVICRVNVNEPFMQDIADQDNIYCWNATSIGNLAYCALHSTSETQKEKFTELLNCFRKWQGE